MRKLAIFLIFLSALTLPAGAQVSLFGLKNSLFQFALEQISVPGELELQAEGVEDAEDGSTEIIGLTVGDAEGVWLKIGRISLNWNASRIVRGELEISRLAASDVEVLRAPASSSVAVEVKPDSELAETDDDPFDWPRSPIATRIDELVAERVNIAPNIIAAQSLAIDLTGSLKDEGDEQSAKFLITRTDDVSGRIVLDFLRDFAADRLNLTLKADEAVGGLVAELAGFPPNSASKVDLSGTGPLNDWTLSLNASADRVFDATGNGKLNATGPLSAQLDFTLTPGEALDPQVAAVLSPNAKIVADIAEDANGVIRINQGAITARDVTLEASGAFDQVAATLDFTLKAEARPGLADLVDGVNFQAFSFDGAAKGALDDLTVTGDLVLDRLTTEAADVGSATLNANIRLAGETIDIAVDGDVDGLRVDRITPDLIGRAEIDLDARMAGDDITLSTLSLQSKPLAITASGAANLAADKADLTYSILADDLEPFVTAYDVNAEGAIRADGAISGALSAPTLKGDASFTGLSFDEEPLGKVEIIHNATFGGAPEGDLNLSASGSRFGAVTFDGGFLLNDEILALSNMTATGLGATVDGDIDIDLSETLATGDVSIDAPDLSQLSEAVGQEVGGGVTGRIRLSSPGDKQAADLDVELNDLQAAGVSLESASVEGAATDILGAQKFDLLVNVEGVDAGVAQVASGQAKASGAIEDVIFDAQLSGVGANGVTLQSVTAKGEAQDALDKPQFNITLGVKGVAAGAAQIATGRATAVGGLDDIKLTAELNSIRVGDATVARSDLTARVKEGLSDDPAINSTVTARAINAAPAELTTAKLVAAGRLSALNLTLSSQGGLETGEEITMDMAARVSAAGPLKATVSDLSAKLDANELRLEAPLRIAALGNATSFNGINLSLAGASLTGDATLHGDGASGKLSLQAPDLRPIAALVDLPMEQGALWLDADFNTRRRGAGAKVSLNASDLRFADAVADLGALTADANVDWDGRDASVVASLSGPFDQPVQARINAPVRPSGGLVPVAPKNGALSGSVDWTGEIGEIWALVPAPGHVLSGLANVAIRLAGTIGSPEFGGDVSLSGGRYENLDVGSILVNLSAQSRISSDGAFAVDLNGEDGAGGDVSAVASVADGRVEATINANSATLVRRDDVTAAVSLDLTAAGPLDAPDIAGQITIDRAEVRLVNATPPGVADIGDVRIKGQERPEPEKASGEDIDLDITIKGPQDIFVRGRGLDSEWKIDLKISGTAADPRIVGVVEKRRGSLDLLGAAFDLERGKVQFSGAKGIDPVVDVLIQRENDGIRGGIAVTGNAADPQIAFVSRPSLPEEEVLPRILFGRSRQSLSPAEALTLGIGVAQLLDGGDGAVGSARGAVGLDVLRIDSDEAGPSVTVGSNVADGVFVGAKQPIGSGSASVQVEVKVFDNITIDSEFGPDVGTSIGLNWKKDF